MINKELNKSRIQHFFYKHIHNTPPHMLQCEGPSEGKDAREKVSFKILSSQNVFNFSFYKFWTKNNEHMH